MQQVRDRRHLVISPVSVWVEVVSSIRRRTGSDFVARVVEKELRNLSTVRFVELNDERARAAVAVGRQLALRGMDAIVVQVAQEFGSTLVTLDSEMAQRAGNLVAVQPVAAF